MDSVFEEYVWNESDDVVVYERDGEEKRLHLQPNLILTRLCEVDTSKYLIGKLEDADPMYDRFLDHLGRGYCNFVEVLGIGRSRDWSKREQKKYKVAKRWTIPAGVGDFLLMPEKDKWGRLWRGVFGKPYLHIAEFHVPILIVGKE